MPHTFVTSYYHCVFSTKHRQRIIDPAIEARLFPYMGGIARSNEMKLLSIGGMPDHVHLLLSLPPTLPLAKAMQILKGNSSHWINKTFELKRRFEWQVGYGAFCVGVSDIPRTTRYIQNQKQHHKNYGFDQEFSRFLDRNGLGSVCRP